MVLHIVGDEILKRLFDIKKEDEEGIDGFGFERNRAEREAEIAGRKEHDSIQSQRALMFIGALIGPDNDQTSFLLSSEWCAFVERYRQPGVLFELNGKYYRLEGLLPQV